MVGVVQKKCGTVGESSLTNEILTVAIEDQRLSVGATHKIGITEMRHQRDFFNLRQGIQSIPSRFELIGFEAQTVHSRIHFQENSVPFVGLVATEPIDLLVRVNCMPELKS